MSEQQFKQAKSALAFSQSLLDRTRMGQQGDMGQGMPPEAPVEAEEAPTETETPQEAPEQKSLVQTIQEAVQPMIDEVKALFSKKDEEPQEVEIKIDGEMSSKEDKEEE